ncbi:NHL domain-containing thioredoxin family protein [Citricoccus muralis]|uniref:NHL domain-containing thioredoxin family protein n=1 Tax=Citricoccus muralis TaxID=169134 RepID=A0ABY8H4K4_9MICC|nr:NHL domain-containing thioredoxin family protein [Citricoccus muralis]WFP16070.1 NHL domain-containing thioredoxin family protein [Citricoccus muralis]
MTTETSASAAGTTPRAPRVRASELVGETWFNTGGEALDLAALRGKIVLLDFWTFCCINCLHVLDELRPLEEEFSDVLVTVGVHSPKFDHEGRTESVAAAVERYDITHPVVNDPALTTWQAYSARAWPTLVVVDPEGYIVAHLSGEGHVAGLRSLVTELVAEHEAKGTLHRGDGPYVAPEPVARDLKFPAKALDLSGRGSRPGSLLVTDTGHHRLVEVDADLTEVLQVIGGNGTGAPVAPEHAQHPDHIGAKGYADGGRDTALFNEPQGVALLPAEVAEQVGYDLVVADSVNHRLRGVSLGNGTVTTLAGNGVQRLIDSERAKEAAAPGPESAGSDAADAEVSVSLEPFATAPLDTSLSSPWDVVWSEAEQTVVVAMAGVHQLFSFDPHTGAVAIYAGTGLEGLLDGAADSSWFAQSSGLSVGTDGTLWVADSETSALRWVRPGNAAGTDTADDENARTVGTVIGEGLFDFGFRDGDPAQARLQHPLGVTALPDGSVLVADTYNGAIRRYAPETTGADGRPVPASVSTVARGLAEPSDVLVEHDAEGKPVSIIVVETNAHQLVRLAVPEEFLQVDEGALQTQRPRTSVATGDFEISIGFAAPTGQKLDDRWGDPTQLKISSSPENLLLDGDGSTTGLTRTLRLNPEVTEGVLHITARAAACDGEPGQPIPDFAACHLYQQDWGIPVTVEPAGEIRLDLDLRGMH